MKKAGTFAGIAAMSLLGLMVILFLVGRATGVVGLHNIPSSSMAPSFPKGAYFITTLFPYWINEPQRGDVITFLVPALNNVTFIKRIIGLPGDHIQMRNGRVVLNGTELPLKKIPDWRQIDPGKSRLQKKVIYRSIRQYEEALPTGKTYRIIEKRNGSALDSTPLYNVPAGHYFVLGDNRDNSLDSRILSSVGYIPRKNIRGKFWTRSSLLEAFGSLASLGPF